MASSKYQVNLGALFAIDLDITGYRYINIGMNILPRIYVGPYLESFSQTFTFAGNDEQLEGTSFGASILYERGDWFFLGTVAPIGSSHFKKELDRPDPSTPSLWSITAGYAVIPDLGFNMLLSYFSRTHGSDTTNGLSNNGLGIGFAFKLNF